MKQILIATRNPGKLHELSNFLSEDMPVECVSLTDLNINDETIEDGKNYYENSKKKALFYAKLSNMPTIADDAGIEIDALGGEPGHKARRWTGKDATDEELIAHMEKVIKTLPDDNMGARYKAVLTLGLPDGRYFQAEGVEEGILSREKAARIMPGYPYDAFFVAKATNRHYHDDLSQDAQKRYNHRYRALEKLKPIIKRVLEL